METITLPRRVVEEMLHVSQAFAELQDELEDYFIAHNPRLLRQLRQARREHVAGKVRPFLPTVA